MRKSNLAFDVPSTLSALPALEIQLTMTRKKKRKGMTTMKMTTTMSPLAAAAVLHALNLSMTVAWTRKANQTLDRMPRTTFSRLYR